MRLIHRVRLKNYRSIASCDVRLGPLTFLVGPNGSGKSNFLDSLRLVADGLNGPLSEALSQRGGLRNVRRRSTGHPTHFTIAVDFELPDGRSGHFMFEVGSKAGGDPNVSHERCVVEPMFELPGFEYEVRDGVLDEGHTSIATPPAVGRPDRLYLVNLSGLPAVRPVFDALSNMGFYNLTPSAMRQPKPAESSQLLSRDGGNLASVVGRLAELAPARLERIVEYLGAIVPGIDGVRRRSLTNFDTLEFDQRVQGADAPWSFYANSMSDGTLRALGILVALFQPSPEGQGLLIGIEEPESALHPAASAVLLEALRAASDSSQVVVTSHSPELLDQESVTDEELLAVESFGGTTSVAPIGPDQREALRQGLYTPGELLRQGQLSPDPAGVPSPKQLSLFTPGRHPSESA